MMINMSRCKLKMLHRASCLSYVVSMLLFLSSLLTSLLLFVPFVYYHYSVENEQPNFEPLLWTSWQVHLGSWSKGISWSKIVWIFHHKSHMAISSTLCLLCLIQKLSLSTLAVTCEFAPSSTCVSPKNCQAVIIDLRWFLFVIIIYYNQDHFYWRGQTASAIHLGVQQSRD